MKFLVQTVDNTIVHDFSFGLLEAIRYHKWSGRNDYMAMVTSKSIDEPGWIPVGSVEFVQDYLKEAYDLTVKPRNVPEELMAPKWSGRTMLNEEFVTIVDLSDSFLHIKSNDKIKAVFDLTAVPLGNYQLSHMQDYTSEWRAFVWRGDLVGLQNYSGDFTEFPDVDRIKEMMRAFSGLTTPCAYTLDVGLKDGGTWVVEVHDFFSCGLYGFADLQLLPLLLGGWFKEFLRENK